jgi:regulatory protein
MKITKISQQVKRASRYSVFVDEKYAFSLSETALLNSKIASGQTLTQPQLDDFKRLSADDKVYGLALRYVAMRPHSTWEVKFYLERKQSPAPLIEQITNKLTDLGLLDDVKYAEMFVANRRLLRPTSRRKLALELRKKRLPDEAIEQALGHESDDEASALQSVITQKRRQTKYQDDLKLMQYLARQGFSYADIKRALSGEEF